MLDRLGGRELPAAQQHLPLQCGAVELAQRQHTILHETLRRPHSTISISLCIGRAVPTGGSPQSYSSTFRERVDLMRNSQDSSRKLNGRVGRPLAPCCGCFPRVGEGDSIRMSVPTLRRRDVKSLSTSKTFVNTRQHKPRRPRSMILSPTTWKVRPER